MTFSRSSSSFLSMLLIGFTSTMISITSIVIIASSTTQKGVFVQAFTPTNTKTTSFRTLNKALVVNHRTDRIATFLQATSTANKATIQILMSDTGGGHRASANALRDAFDELYPGQIEVDIVDIFTEYGPFYPFDSFVPIYKIMAEYPILWEIAFKSGETPLGLFLNEFFLEFFCFEPFKKCMLRPSGSSGKRADMVVSVHPLTQDIPIKILNDIDSQGSSRTEGRVTPFATVVTDLAGAYPAWFNPKVDKCFVPSDVLYQAAEKRGLTSEQLVQYGLPIRRGFWASTTTKMTDSRRVTTTFGGMNFLEDFFASLSGGGKKTSSMVTSPDNKKTQKTQLQSKLGIEDGLPTVLIVGGGDGMGGIIAQAKAMGQKLSQKSKEDGQKYQMVVVCGNNQKAQETLMANAWGEGVAVTVNGFVNNMDEWMRSSDVIVTKAGPGTIAEASICGLPCMLSSFLPGQEEGNVPYVQNAGFGSYSGNPTTIAETVSSWLSSPEMLQTMQAAALAAARPTATIDIAKDLATMLFESKKKQDATAKVKNEKVELVS